MEQDHMTGLCVHHENPNFALMRASGVRWCRLHLPYPWLDRIDGQYDPEFLRAIGEIVLYRRQGFQPLVTTPALGSMHYDAAAGDTVWHPGYPAWMGTPEEDFFHEALEAGVAEMARMTEGLVEWWQLGNEPDFPVFIGPTGREANLRFNRTLALAFHEYAPQAKTGINLAGVAGENITEYALWITEELYRKQALPYAYLGLDGYFGCWQPGGPENWVGYIDRMHTLSGKPILINEWGFSTIYSAPFERDPERKLYYNNENCRAKTWQNKWNGQEHSPEVQADYIRQTLEIFAGHPACIGNFFFRWSDSETCWQCGEHNCPTETHWGITDLEQRPLPGYFALQEGNRRLFGR